MPVPKPDLLRWVLSIACVLSLTAAIVFIAYLFESTPVQIKVTNYDTYRTEVLKMTREEALGFLQIGVAVLGALWTAMIVSEDNRLRRTDLPEILMFGATSVLLLM